MDIEISIQSFSMLYSIRYAKSKCLFREKSLTGCYFVSREKDFVKLTRIVVIR